ncbi:MAG: hypothetical protein ACERKD_17710 [Prolixibacteraceae bacterium]
MKFNPLRDWHFTLSMESTFEQSNVFLNSLDIISWQNSNYNALQSAIEQINLLDDYYKIYAYPQILIILSEIEADNLKNILRSFCYDFLVKIDCESYNKLNDSEHNNFLDTYLKEITSLNKIKESDKLGTYQDIYQFKETSTLLSHLYVKLTHDPDFLRSFKIEYEDEDERTLKDFIEDAYRYQYGRFAFIIAARIIRLVDFENYKNGLIDHIYKYVVYNDIHLNPDLTELIIDASYFDIESEHNDIDQTETLFSINEELLQVEKEKIIKNIKEEFYDLILFDRLTDRNKGQENNYYFEQLREPITPNNPTPFEYRTKALTITYWQFNLLYTLFLKENKISLAFFASIIIEPENKINFLDLPKENQSLIAVYNLKNTFRRTDNNKVKHSIDDIKKQVYSPLPKIEISNKGILMNNNTWFQHSEDQLLYFRTSIFGYLNTLYLSINLSIDSVCIEPLLKLSVFCMRFHREYWDYIKIRDHKEYDNLINKKTKQKETIYNFSPCLGSEKQISIQRVFYERNKSISSLPNLNLFKKFSDKINASSKGYKLTINSTYDELYLNIILPNSIFFWIIQTYLSLEKYNNSINILTSVIAHEATIKNSADKKFYKLGNFINNQLISLYSFFTHADFSMNYAEYSPLNLNLTNAKARIILSFASIDELIKLINTPNRNKTGNSLVLNKSIRIIEIVNNNNLYDTYSNDVDSALKDLEIELSSIYRTLELDRYVRLQLIRLINNELLLKVKNDTLRELIVFLILEYGCIYDIDLLFNTIFEFGNKRAQQQVLQKKLINGFYSLLKNSETEKGLINSPYNALYHKNKLDFIQRKLDYLAFMSLNEPFIKGILNRNNIGFVKLLYGEQGEFYQESIDNFSNEKTDAIHSIYYDPNSYSTSILLKGEKQLSKTFNGNPIKLMPPESIKWNSIDNLKKSFNYEIVNFKQSEWIVDIIGIKQQLIDFEYVTLKYQTIKNENPYPFSLFELICGIQIENKILRLVLISNNYLNPITGEKGHLWTYAIGMNVFIKTNDYLPDTKITLNNIFDDIKNNYAGIVNPTKSLIVYFKISFPESEKIQLSISNEEKHLNELKTNISILYELLPTIKKAYKRNNSLFINLENNGISSLYNSEIKILPNELPLDESIEFEASDYFWNPFIDEISPIRNNYSSNKPKENARGLKNREYYVKEKRNEKIETNEYQEYDYNLQRLKDYLQLGLDNKPNLNARIDSNGNVKLFGLKLPADLKIPINQNTIWTDTFNYKKIKDIKVYKLSPDFSNSSFFNDFKKESNAFLDLRKWEDGLYMHSLKVRPIYFPDFKNWFATLGSKDQKQFQLTFIGLYDKDVYNLNHIVANELKEYVFEFGYGRILILNENQLSINNISVSKYKSIIFHGDRITNITITSIGIYSRKIEFFTSKLYNDSLNKNVIHTLYIDSKTKIIKRVESPGSAFDIKTNFIDKNINGLLKLSEESLDELKLKECESEEIILYAKIIEKTNYRNIEFNIVKLSNEDDSLNNKLMFFKAENIYYENNSYKLKIIPLVNSVSATNTEIQFNDNCYIKKRDFSADANTLVKLFSKRLDENKRISGLIKDEILLVHLSYERSKVKYNFSLIGPRESILYGNFFMPIRHGIVLSKKLEKEDIIAVVVNFNTYSEKYRLELRPGIFVELGVNNDEHFKHGDIVKIIKVDGIVLFRLLIPSDIRYFENTKLINILPKNNISEINPNKLDENNFYNNKYFIASEFANIELKLKKTNKLLDYLKKENNYALINKFIANIDIPNTFRFKQVDISFDQNWIRIFSPDKHIYKIGSSQLSFMEASYFEIRRRILDSQWKFVDEKTQIWKNDRWDSKSIKIRKYSNSLVPAYLLNSDQLTFRYPFFLFGEKDITELSKVSLPTSSLIDYLEINNIITVTLICEYYGKIFIELSPGRIVELQKGYIKIQSSNLGLNNFPSGLLGTGDSLVLRLKNVNHYNYENDTIELLEWIPSGRSSFNDKSILPINNNMDVLIFGKGNFQMKVPTYVAKPKIEKGYYFFNTQNNYYKIISNAFNIQPYSTTLVFLENDKIKITIPSFDDYKIIIRGKDHFLNEWFTVKNIIKLIKVAGGYLPVTINSMNHVKKEVNITRDYQTKIRIYDNEIILTLILGMLDEKTILLKSGPLLISYDLQEIDKYIPADIISDYNSLSNLKRYLGNRFYITRTLEKFAHGINIDSQNEKDFDSTFVSLVKTKDKIGIIVFNLINKTLHFVDFKNISWINPPMAIDENQLLQYIFTSKYKTRIKLRIGKVNSIIDNELAKSEFDGIHKGKIMSIEYILKLKDAVHPTIGYNYHLVKSKISGIIMLAESNLDDNAIKKIKIGLVIDYSNKEKTVLVAVGDKRIVMDTYLIQFENPDFRHIDIKNAFILNLNSVDKNDYNRYCEIGKAILKENRLSLFKPLYYLKFVYALLSQNIDDSSTTELKNIFISIIKDVSVRAMRERHTEILISKWLNNEDAKNNKYSLWSRMNNIGKIVFNDISSEVSKELYIAIENLNKIAIPLRPVEETEEFIEMSKALMIAIGQNNGIVISNSHTPIVSLLVELGIDASNNENNIFTNKSIINRVEDILKRCEIEGNYFFLRDNLLSNFTKIIDKWKIN